MTREEALNILREAEVALPPEVLASLEGDARAIRALRGSGSGTAEGAFRIKGQPTNEPVIGMTLENAARNLRRATRQVTFSDA